MVGEILLDSMPVKKRRCSLSGKPVLILVSLQTESYEEEYVGITLTHSAKIKIFSENSVSFEGTTASHNAARRLQVGRCAGLSGVARSVAT